MNWNFLFRLFGLLYLVIGLLSFYNVIFNGEFYGIFWFCYQGIFIIGLGFLLRNNSIIRSQIYILFFPDIVWVSDFLSYLIFGNSFFGIVDYIFIEGPLLPKIISLQHIFTVPLVLFLLSKMKFKNDRIWIVSCFQFFLFFVLIRVLTPESYNINCAFRFCGDYTFGLNNAIYPFVWLAAGFLMIYLTNFIILRIYSLIKNK